MTRLDDHDIAVARARLLSRFREAPIVVSRGWRGASVADRDGMLKWLAVVAIASGCAGDDTVEWYSGVEGGSTWHLTLGAGTPHRNSNDTCPTIAPIRIELPSSTCSSTCGRGKACTLTFILDDAGDALFETYSVTSDFTDDCGSGTLSCGGDDAEHDTDVSCSFSDTDSTVPYCDYPGQLVEVD